MTNRRLNRKIGKLVIHPAGSLRRAAVFLALGLLVYGCSERQRLYSGPPRPAEQVALLTNQWGFWDERVLIFRVDATKIPRQSYTYEVELSPGPHVVEFGYDGGAHGHSLENAVLLLNAEAGHHYEARADWIGFDPDSDAVVTAVFGGPGTWAASIFDITTQRTVAPTPSVGGMSAAPK